MTLRAVVDSLDDVPEALHAEYAEREGKFYLDLDETIRTHHLVVPLANTVSNTRRERDEARRRLAEREAVLNRLGGAEAIPEDLTADSLREMREELERLRNDPSNRDTAQEQAALRTRYEERIRLLETRNNAEHQRAVEAERTRAGELEAELEERIRSDALTEALIGIGIKKEGMNGARAILAPNVKVVTDDDRRRRAVVETDLGEVDVAKYVDSWARSDEGKFYVVPASGVGAQGGGATRSSGVNPFSHDSWDVTAQGAMVRERGLPHAQRLAAAAGTTVGGTRPERRGAAA